MPVIAYFFFTGTGLGSQKKARHPLTSRLYVQPPAQSSARGSVIAGQERPALLRRSRLTFFMAERTTTRRIKASVRNKIKFHDAISLVLKAAVETLRFAIGDHL